MPFEEDLDAALHATVLAGLRRRLDRLQAADRRETDVASVTVADVKEAVAVLDDEASPPFAKIFAAQLILDCACLPE